MSLDNLSDSVVTQYDFEEVPEKVGGGRTHSPELIRFVNEVLPTVPEGKCAVWTREATNAAMVTNYAKAFPGTVWFSRKSLDENGEAITTLNSKGKEVNVLTIFARLADED